MDREDTAKTVEAEIKYPGAAVDAADGEKVTQESVDEETLSLNNNPRNDQ